MERIGLLKSEKMGNYEKEKGYASYRTIVERFIGDIVLCNNIINIDENVGFFESNIKYYNEKGEEITEDEYLEDDNAYAQEDTPEFYQYYLCNVGQWEKEQLQKMGIYLDYSDVLDCDVLCVDHYGTSWDYVLTDVKLFDTYEELEKYERGEE